jgi:hypothetical protein
LVDIDEQSPSERKNVKKFVLEQSVPNNRFGLKHCYTENLLKPAIHDGVKSGDDRFAIDLIEANPHGFTGGSDVKPESSYNDPEVVELLGVLSNESQKQKYIDLCKKQPKMPASYGNKMCIIS